VLRRIGSLLSACAAVSFVLVACTAPSAVKTATQSVEVNRAVGKAEDQVTVMNIMRSYLRRPRAYTDFSAFHEAVPTSSGTATLSGTPSLAGTVSSATSAFDVTPETQQGFIRAITTPVPAATVAYYSQQGWINSELLHLFVHEIRVYDSNDKLQRIYSNYPQDTESYDEFDAIVNGLAACDLTVKTASVTLDDALGPEIDLKDVHEMKPQYDAAKNGFVLAPYPTSAPKNATAAPLSVASPKVTRFILVKASGRDQVFKLVPRNSLDAARICLAGYALAGVERPKIPGSLTGTLTLPPDTHKGWYMKLGIRSPESIVYYLGEVARVQLDGAYPSSNSDGKIDVGPYQSTHRRGIGVVQYSEGCSYDPLTNQSSDCYATCRPFFVMHKNTDERLDAGTYCSIPQEAACEAQKPGSSASLTYSCSPPPALHAGKPVTYDSIWSSPRIQVSDSEIKSEAREPHTNISTDSSVKYAVSLDPEDDAETLHVLSILEQLIGLQTSSTTDAPGNSAIAIEP